MEVHHHTHSSTSYPSTSSGHRKKWTHYFWEFLMLFLAVFAGFMAENQREHFIEHKRAKTYASNLYSELLKDSAALTNLSEWTDTLIRRFDTLCSISSPDLAVTNGKLYF